MRARKLDNFKRWRDEMKRIGKIKSSYPALKKSGNLAELIGTVLGDGHIAKHPRCDSLRIVGDAAKMGFVYRAAMLVEIVFAKKPAVAKRTSSNAVTVTIYERKISERLGVPAGSRHALDYKLPRWIERSRRYKIRFLRGLYEAEGSVSHHAPTSTHKMSFANTNPHLQRLVSRLLTELGFTHNIHGTKVQVSRAKEVQNLKDLLQFRNYDT